jgi:hypothetical protein
MVDMSLADKIRRTQFLGREFLTWLMARSAREDGIFHLGNGEVLEVFFERALTLDGENPARERSAMKVDDPTNSEEVRLSLRLGKKVSMARLMVVKDGREFTFVLDGGSLSLRQVKLPDTQALDPVEGMAEKSALCAELEDAVHDLFAQFVRLRLDPEAWAAEARPVGAWIDSEADGTAPEDADEETPPPPAPRRGGAGSRPPAKGARSRRG